MKIQSCGKEVVHSFQQSSWISTQLADVGKTLRRWNMSAGFTGGQVRDPVRISLLESPGGVRNMDSLGCGSACSTARCDLSLHLHVPRSSCLAQLSALLNVGFNQRACWPGHQLATAFPPFLSCTGEGCQLAEDSEVPSLQRWPDGKSSTRTSDGEDWFTNDRFWMGGRELQLIEGRVKDAQIHHGFDDETTLSGDNPR